jgi:hypothetical protein
MAHPLHHAQSSARKHGGKPEDYLAIHQWFDESKAFHADFRHRAMRHHAEGIFMAERFFGVSVRNSDGKEVPTRFIGEQHVKEDLGFIPSVSDWLACIQGRPWMASNARHGPKAEAATTFGRR